MGRDRYRLVLWLAVLLGCVLVIARAPIESDLSLFLPDAATPTQQTLLSQLHSGAAGRLLLVALQAPSPAAAADASQALTATLRRSPLVSYVANGYTSLSDADLALLFAQRYLLSPAVEEPGHFAADALRRKLNQGLERLASPLAVFERARFPADPTAELAEVMRQWRPNRGPADYRGVWFSADGQRALIVVQTVAPAFDVDGQAAVLDELRRVLAQSGDEVRAEIAGAGVIAVATRDVIQREAFYLSLLGTAGVALLLLWAFRSPSLLALSLLPFASGVCLAIAVVSLVFGHVHGISIAFGVTLLGVASDYPIHLFMHTRTDESPQYALRRIWPTLRLGVGTTAISYVAMVFSGFTGLAQLGLFALVGLVTAAAVTRWVLPAWIGPRLVARVPRTDMPLRAAQTASAIGFRVIAIGAVLVAGGYLAVREAPPWQTDLASLSPVPAEAKRVDRELRAQLGAPDVRQLLIVSGATAEEALLRCEQLLPQLNALAQRDAITDYDAACRYLPSVRTQQSRQAALPDAAELRRNLARAIHGLPFKRDVFAPFMENVAQAKSGPVLDVDRVRATGFGVRVETLLYKDTQDWVGAIPLHGVRDPDAVAALAREHGALYLDLKAESEQLVAEYRDRALQVWLYGTLVLVALLAVGLRSLLEALRVLLPVCASVILVCAALVVAGQTLSLFHLVSLLLVVGVGIDYGLFFNMTTWQTDERRRTALAVALCAGTTFIAFGVLALSSIPALAAIGSTVALGAGVSLAMSAIFARPAPFSPAFLGCRQADRLG